MTGFTPILALALLALLVGATLPVLYQLYQVLRRARTVLDTAGPRLEKALDQVGQAADRIGAVGSTLEAQAQTLGPLFDVASSLGRTIHRTGSWLGTAVTIGGAVGPAVVAGVRALFSGTDDRETTSARPARQSIKGNGSSEQHPRSTS